MQKFDWTYSRRYFSWLFRKMWKQKATKLVYPYKYKLKFVLFSMDVSIPIRPYFDIERFNIPVA